MLTTIARAKILDQKKLNMLTLVFKLVLFALLSFGLFVNDVY